ncbi:MAG: LON peptidase substrate-binding domain-containing protein [Candidatus Promineofilum sp.]|nr:LON peptidase substrate-binding domain-containing protein [Promineifilum sp.]
MPLPLHIFEERYKAMIADCIRDGRPFGVVLIAEGAAEGGPPATPHAIGCTAEVVQVQPLDEGRMLIVTVGRERFRIVRLHHDRPYLVGVVEPAPAGPRTRRATGRRRRPAGAAGHRLS